MRVNPTLLTGAALWSMVLLPSTTQASELISPHLLTGENGTSLSTEQLLGTSQQQPLKPVLSKRNLPNYPVPEQRSGVYLTSRRQVAGSPFRSDALVGISQPASPTFSSGERSRDAEQTPQLAELLPTAADFIATIEEASQPSQDSLSAVDSTAGNITSFCDSDCTADDTTIARALPSLEEIQQIQEDLRNLNDSNPTAIRRTIFPGIAISNPSGYGADRGQVFAGIGYQSRTRFSGGSNPGSIFGGGAQDGVAGIGFGIGNARESVGLQISYTAASFGGSRSPLSGGFNAKLHKQFGNGLAAAIGGEGIINVGRLPEGVNGEVEFNDFEGTYYGVATYTIPLRENYTDAFSRLTLNAGLGTGRFRSSNQIINGDSTVGVFGTAALQVLPSTNLITEWTGQDLAVGVSVAPFPNFPLVFTPAIRDIVGEGDGDPRFVLGVGISLSDVFSKLFQ